MHQHGIGIGGGVIFWKIAAETSKETVQDGLRDLGLAPMCPVERTKAACVKTALGEIFKPDDKEHRYAVRSNKGGFVVASERHKEEGLYKGDQWAEVVARVELDENDNVTLYPYDADRLDELHKLVRKQASTYSASAISTCLVELIEFLGGVALRKGGGVYWLNDAQLATWEQIAQVFEQAGENMIHVMRVVADDQMVRAVADSLTEEVTAAVAKLSEDLDSLTEAQAIRRISEASQMLKKVRNYEAAFQSPLDHLTKAIETLGGQIAIATLTAAAGESVEYATV